MLSSTDSVSLGPALLSASVVGLESYDRLVRDVGLC